MLVSDARSGGLESLFGDVKNHTLSLPKTVDGRPVDLRALIAHLRKDVLVDQHRPELFVQGDTVSADHISASS